ncbi:hypothetical protein BKA61DRAFT_280172 [Leptodontidium sp. MPI-SDFR-AT-0119]|nr:hypothetical protein BKA61DRAFT_280172 [Leptodontidium sp. MPI-SDFR-AT-0119]
MTVTEVGLMGVKPGLNIMDETTQEGQVLFGAWNSVIAAPTGPHQVYFGLEIENPLRIWAFFDWDSLEHHATFAKTFGGEAVKDLPTILTHGEFTNHVIFKPFPPAVLRSPVTQVIIAYFPSDFSPGRKDATAARIQQILEKSHGECTDVKGLNIGWGVENNFPVRGGDEGQTGSVLQALIGWPSVVASQKFQETEAFKESLDSIKALEGVVKSEVFHISCRTLERR